MTKLAQPDTEQLFKLLRAIDVKKPDRLKREYASDTSSIAPYVVQRWLSGDNTSFRILVLNNTYNRYVSRFTPSHTLLLWFLASVSALPNSSFQYAWPKSASKTKAQVQNKEILVLIANYYGCSLAHAKDYASILTSEQILTIIQDSGADKSLDQYIQSIK